MKSLPGQRHRFSAALLGWLVCHKPESFTKLHAQNTMETTMETTVETATFYPLAVGNSWTYQMSNGDGFTNQVTAANGTNAFTMVNSILNIDQHIRKEGELYLADNFEAGNFQPLLRDDVKIGDTWEIRYKANGFENILVMVVKETGASKEVAGTLYDDVMMIEGESKMLMNGNLIALNFFTQYFYARGIGLILTTSSVGDSMALVSCQLC
ncbi:MAG: hypothetical protein JNJ94_01430 [Chlorobi bacterium]|nr:hypothetical protein [Chlorobiota bacterium]